MNDCNWKPTNNEQEADLTTKEGRGRLCQWVMDTIEDIPEGRPVAVIDARGMGVVVRKRDCFSVLAYSLKDFRETAEQSGEPQLIRSVQEILAYSKRALLLLHDAGSCVGAWLKVDEVKAHA